jgi:hypothetical protein
VHERLRRPSFVRPLSKCQIETQWLGHHHGVLAHVNRPRLWQVGRAIGPAGKGQRRGVFLDWPQTNTKGGGFTPTAAPAFPESGFLNQVALGLGFVVNPEEFEHDIFKEKAPIGRALARVRVGLAFSQAELNSESGLPRFAVRTYRRG